MNLQLSRLSLSVFVLFVVSSTNLLWGEAIALSLFIIHVGIEKFAYALLFDAGLRVVIANVYSVLQRRMENTWLWAGGGLVAIVGIWVGREILQDDATIGYIVIYLAYRILAQILRHYALSYLATHYVHAMNHRRDQLMQLIVGSRSITGILGVVLILLVTSVSESTLLNIWMIGIGVSVVIIIALGEFIQEPPDQEKTTEYIEAAAAEGPRIRQLSRLTQHGLVRWLTISALSVSFLTTMVLYRTVVVVEKELSGFSELIAFFSLVSALGSWITIQIEYRMLSNLLQQYNAGRLASVYPGVLGLSLISMFLIPIVPSAVLGDFSRKSLRQSLYSPIERLLYHALPAGEEALVRRLTNGLIEPLGAALASVLLILVATNTPLLLVGVGVSAFFLVAAQQSGFLYGETLASSLSAGQYRFLRQTAGEWELRDQTRTLQLIERLKVKDYTENELLLIAEVVSQSELEAGYEVLRQICMESPPNLQVELLPLVINGWSDRCSEPDNRELISLALGSEESALRRQAMRLIAVYPELDPDYEMARSLIDSDPEVSTVAASVLLRHPSHQIQYAARAQLRWLATSRNATTRVLAVTTLVKGSLNAFGEVIADLDVPQYLGDSSTRVRQAALPAATIDELIKAACDSSADVRTSAIVHLADKRFQGSRRRLTEVLEQAEKQLHDTGGVQINSTLGYWHLLVAVTSVSRQAGRRRQIEALESGFKHLEMLQMIVRTLEELNEPILDYLIQQIQNDYDDLLETIVDYLGAIFGKARMEAIVLTLQSNPALHHQQEQITAQRALQSFISPPFAEKFTLALQRDVRVLDHQHSVLPRVVFRILLEQIEEWRPVLTLYALSRLPVEKRQRWVDGELFTTSLEPLQKSSLDFIREAVRQILKASAEESEADSSIGFERELEGSVMLSTMERMLFLRNVSFFENLRLDQLRALARGCEEIAAVENQRIIKQGDAGDSLFIVVEGNVRIERRSEGEEHGVVLTRMGPSDVVGEISLLDGDVRTADVIAETSALLLSIHSDALNAALDDDPGIAMTMLRTMAQRVRRTTELLDIQMHQNVALTQAENGETPPIEDDKVKSEIADKV
jgi:CRP-like cAMP-binding protein